MIVVVLILILAGSLTGAAALWMQDASWWQIALGYAAGGWGGLLAGLPVAMLGRGLAALNRSRRRKRAQVKGVKHHNDQNGGCVVMPSQEPASARKPG